MATKKQIQRKPASKRGRKPVEPQEISRLAPPKGFKKLDDGSIRGFRTVGDQIEGTFDRLEEIKKKNRSNIIHMKDEHGNSFKVGSTKGLERQLTDNGIKKGDYILMHFAGVAKLSGGRTFKIMELFVKEK